MITLYGSGLCSQQLQIEGHIAYKSPEYPASKLVRDEKSPKAAEWWRQGVFLYEMLTITPVLRRRHAPQKVNLSRETLEE